MALRVFASAFLSAVLMFFWGFVYWGPVLNMTPRLLSTLPAEAELDVLAPLRSAKTPDGMYAYPGPLESRNDEKAVAAWNAKIEEGPIVHLSYHGAGVSPMDPAMMAKGFIHVLIVALLAAILLAAVVHGLPTYAGRVGVLVLATLIAAVWTNVADVIWWFDTPRYAAGQMVYELVAGMLMALVTAAIIRPHASAAGSAPR